MKRCPECGREYDNTMMFCLDDGAELLYGPASMDEPATAILHETAPPNEAATRAQIHTTEQTAVLPSGISDAPKAKGLDKRLILAPLAVAAIVLGGFFGYRYITQARQINSIAVMPFVNETGNSEIEYLSDGMTDTLISSLSNLPNMSVKAHSSVFRYKGKQESAQTIGRELNVQAILTGRVAQRGDQLTLTLDLVDTQTENVIWSDRYNRKQADIVSLQSEIARDVSSKLRSRLSGADEQKIAKTYTTDPEAYQLYLKGLFHWNKRTAESLRTAIEYFNKAVEKDPGFALAYAGMSKAYVLLPLYSAATPDDAIPKAKAAAKKALDLDETVAEAHTALGNALFSYDRNIPDSNREFQRAIELNPNYATAHQWYANNLAATQRFDEAIAEGKRAVELDPLSLVVNLELAGNYYNARQFDQSIAQFRKTVELDRNWYLAHMLLSQTYNMTGQFSEALAEGERARELNDDPLVLAWIARSHIGKGRRDEAIKLLGEMTEAAKHRYVPAYGFAVVYAGLGDKDQAFQWLERSLQDRAWDVLFLKVDPLMETLHADPRFADLVRRIGV